MRDTPPRGIGRMAVRVITASISASYHMLNAGGAGARGNAEKGDETDEWIEVTRRNQQPDQCGEHDKRHNSRLHKRDSVARARVTPQQSDIRHFDSYGHRDLRRHEGRPVVKR